ncbi:MAG: exodeoxyribonuclease V subunit alpha [Deltaproteobacteria bacterium]|nr:exodeoxyribonuclease V subunit alpha [Deltaproteobacteria bacterium]
MTAPLNPRSGEFSTLERHFANLMERLSGASNPELWLASALLCRQTAAGHVCLDLSNIGAESLPLPQGIVPFTPSLTGWLEVLARTPVVGPPGARTPLILAPGTRLYLNRYWNYERELIDKIDFLINSEPQVEDSALASGLARLFPPSSDREPDWQKVAAAVAVLKRFCIISGGPGSGKTTVVFKVLLLLLEQPQPRPPRILLAAPTGKAAARLRDTLRVLKQRHGLETAAAEAIPDEVCTLHRLLGYHPLSGACRHHAGNPLPCDLLAIDEASMVDLPLLVRVLRALPEQARLVLLGDHHQLASVEAGAVLNDLCGALPESRFSSSFSRQLAHLCGFPQLEKNAGTFSAALNDSLVILQKSHRFDETGGIGRISRLINAGQGRKAMELLAAGGSDCRLEPSGSPAQLACRIVDKFRSHYQKLFESPDPSVFLQEFSRFMVLCALRQGPWGSLEFNGLLERELTRHGWIPAHRTWYHGRPLLITRNDYRLGLFNGDLGVIFAAPGDDRPKAFFPSEQGMLRCFSPARLPPHETAFAMTVHKSQGSEFERVTLLLPDRGGETLTRELLYTGLTRARTETTVFGSRAVVLDALERRVNRASGLSDHFWGSRAKPEG